MTNRATPEPSDRARTIVPFLLAHSTLYAWTVTIVLFAVFTWLGGMDFRVAGLVAAFTGGGVWYSWRPSGPISRNWAERIAKADGGGDEREPEDPPPSDGQR